MVESKLCVGNCLGLHQRQNSSRLWVTGLPSKSDCHSLGKVQGESYLFRCSFGSWYLSHVSDCIIEELWGIVVNSSIFRGYICLLYNRGGYKPYRVATPPQGVPFFGTPPCLIRGCSLHFLCKDSQKVGENAKRHKYIYCRHFVFFVFWEEINHSS